MQRRFWFLDQHEALSVRVTDWLERLSSHARRYRFIYGVVALMLFVIGLWISLRSLKFELTELNLLPLVANLLIGAPIAICFNAMGLQVAGRITGISIGFFHAFHVTILAMVTNILPVPAGTILHSSALSARGVGLAQAGGVILLGNLATLGLIATLVGVALLDSMPALAIILLIAGLPVFVGSVLVVKYTAGRALASAFVFLRLGRALILVLRVQLCFLGIGVSVTLAEAVSISGAVILGTTAAVFPAGLGISEALAATIAAALSLAPAAAFMATALNRVTTLVVAGMLIPFVVWRRKAGHA